MKDIIIFSGQSNMQGQTDALLYDTPVKNALEYRYLTDELIPLKNPCGEDIAFDGTSGFYHGTPGMTDWHGRNALGSAVYKLSTMLPAFCEAYINTARELGCERTVTAVHAAKGATRMEYWMPGSAAYDVFVKKCRGAIAKTGDVGRKFVVWLQGESDAIASMSCADYKSKLSEFGHSLRDELGIDRFGIIRVGRFTGDARDDEIIRAQDELCAEDEFFVMLTREAADFCVKPEYSKYMNPNVRGHYSALGLCRLGELGGAELARYIQNK
nr:hypothetical protein [Clostridia bacterium]